MLTSETQAGAVTWWRNNNLSVVLIALFVASMAGQLLTGWYEHNSDAAMHGEAPAPLSEYLLSGHFWEATGENWESEFLQMAMFVLLTVHLRQKGSAESKRIDTVEDVDLDPRRFRNEPDVPAAVRAGGWRLVLFENSLGLAFSALFILSFSLHAAGGLQEFNDEQRTHGRPPVAIGAYVTSSRFWFESFQNWQSEFLSLAAMVIGTVYLRQRGSAESKPVHAAHSDTGR